MGEGTVPATINKRIPQAVLSVFKDGQITSLYYSILNKLIEETLPEGSTILQILVVERASFYFVKVREIEMKGEEKISSELRFYTWEYNRNMEILRQLSIRNLPAQQASLLAKRTIGIIERVVKEPGAKDKIIKELIREFTIEIPVTGFESSKVEISMPL